MPLRKCQQCDKEFTVDDADVNAQVICPECGCTSEPTRTEMTVVEQNVDRRLRPMDEQNRAWIIEEASRSIYGVTFWMLTLAYIGMFICALATTCFLSCFVSLWATQFRLNWRDWEKLHWAGGFAAAFPYFYLLMYSSKRLRSLDSIRWGYCAASMSIIPFLLCGPCTLISVPLIVCGIVALIALAKWEVRQVIRWNQEKALD